MNWKKFGSIAAKIGVGAAQATPAGPLIDTAFRVAAHKQFTRTARERATIFTLEALGSIITVTAANEVSLSVAICGIIDEVEQSILSEDARAANARREETEMERDLR